MTKRVRELLEKARVAVEEARAGEEEPEIQMMSVRVPMDIRRAMDKFRAKSKKKGIDLKFNTIIVMALQEFFRNRGLLSPEDEESNNGIRSLEKRLEAIEQALKQPRP